MAFGLMKQQYVLQYFDDTYRGPDAKGLSSKVVNPASAWKYSKTQARSIGFGTPVLYEKALELYALRLEGQLSYWKEKAETLEARWTQLMSSYLDWKCPTCGSRGKPVSQLDRDKCSECESQTVLVATSNNDPMFDVGKLLGLPVVLSKPLDLSAFGPVQDFKILPPQPKRSRK